MSRQLAMGVVFLLLHVGTAEARTWRVERDGSGDFTTIQPAIEASAPGDTVLLGPGRYVEFAPFRPKRWPEPTYVAITVDSLTLRGIDRETVIIGPTVPDFEGFGPKGIVTHRDVSYFLLESVTLENLYTGAYLLNNSDVQDCVFRYCFSGITEWTIGSHVRDCVFLENENGIGTFSPCSDLTIEDCLFVVAFAGLGIGVNSSSDVSIERCQFTASEWPTTGIQYADGSSGSVVDCEFDGTQAGVAVRSVSDVTLVGNTFLNQQYSLFNYNHSNVQGYENEFQGSYTAVRFGTTSTATLSNNHIVKTGLWAVHCDSYSQHHIDLDLRNNYWGTDNADSIAAWIYDGNDAPYPPFVPGNCTVLFDPFSHDTVEVEEQSMGQLKSRFHQR